MSKIVDILMSRTAFAVVAVFAVGFFVYDIRTSAQIYGANVRCWNLPNISITFALLLALYLARQIDPRMRAALHELWLQGTIPEAADPHAGLQQRILAGRGRKEAGAALLIVLVMVAAYLWSEAPHLPHLLAALTRPPGSAPVSRDEAISFLAAASLGILSGAVAGAFFGRLATYGSMAAVLADPQTPLNIRPGHFDGANGLKPVGDFYLFQALLTAIPLTWLLVWILILPWYHSAECFAGGDPAFTERVRWQFYGQWIVVAAFTYLGFIRPVLRLRHRLTQVRASLMQDRIPLIEGEIAQLKSTLIAGAPDAERRSAVETRIHDLARERWAIRHMSRWPMDRATFSKYAPLEIVSNVAPVFWPLISIGEAQARTQAGETSSWALNMVLHALFL
jgi:hypothetical protein